MKGILIVLLIFPMLAKGQAGNYDSLVQRILKLETDNKQIHDNLVRSHGEFRTGTAVFLVGVVVTTASFALADSQTVGLNGTMGMIGTVMMGLGGILQLDSHKYIGRAGTKRIKFKLR